MRYLTIRIAFVLFSSLVFIGISERACATETLKATRPKIYDESADGAKQIADALSTASLAKKRVMIQFGGNWCGWCHKLHNLLAEDPALSATLSTNYVTVLIDCNDRNKHLNARYGNPMQHGLPVIVILESDGRQLTTKNTSELEEGRNHNRERVLAFLTQWAPKQ